MYYILFCLISYHTSTSISVDILSDLCQFYILSLIIYSFVDSCLTCNSSAILSDTGLDSCIFTKYASRLTSSLLKNVVYSLKASALIGQVVLSLKRRTGLSSDAFQTSFKSPTSVNSFGSAIFIYLFLKVQIRFYTFNCFS